MKKNDADEEKTEEPGNPGDYEADPDDENLKYNLLNSELAIRVYKSYANKEKVRSRQIGFCDFNHA